MFFNKGHPAAFPYHFDKSLNEFPKNDLKYAKAGASAIQT